jgi:hypothetical protein
MKTPTFSARPNKSDVPYQGYTNSATALFILYINNEREWHEKCVSLRYNKDKLINYLKEIPVKIDSWAKGKVNLEEVAAEFVGNEEYNAA